MAYNSTVFRINSCRIAPSLFMDSCFGMGMRPPHHCCCDGRGGDAAAAAALGSALRMGLKAPKGSGIGCGDGEEGKEEGKEEGFDGEMLRPGPGLLGSVSDGNSAHGTAVLCSDERGWRLRGAATFHSPSSLPFASFLCRSFDL